MNAYIGKSETYTVCYAELYGILMATSLTHTIINIERQPGITSTIIYTDNRAAIQQVKDPNSTKSGKLLVQNIVTMIVLKSGTPLLLELRTHIHFLPKLSCFVFIHPCDRIIHPCDRVFHFYDWAPHLSHISCSPCTDHFWSEHETPLLFTHAFESLDYYIHVLSIFCSEHRACHLVSHFSSLFFFAHRRWLARHSSGCL